MFNWRAHIDNITLKLIGANARFYKVKDHVNAKILKANYHTLFESHIHCSCICSHIFIFKRLHFEIDSF